MPWGTGGREGGWAVPGGLGWIARGRAFSPHLPPVFLDGSLVPKRLSSPSLDAAVPSTPSPTCRQRCPFLPPRGSLPTLPSRCPSRWVTPGADGRGAGAGVATGRWRGPSSLPGTPVAAHQATHLLHRPDILCHAGLRRLHAIDLYKGLGEGVAGVSPRAGSQGTRTSPPLCSFLEPRLISSHWGCSVSAVQDEAPLRSPPGLALALGRAEGICSGR